MLRNCIKLLLVLSLSSLLMACIEILEPRDLEKDLNILAQEVTSEGVPGVLVYLDRPNRSLTVVAGVVNRSTGAPLDGTETLRLGSITKPYIAALTIQLSNAGLLQLDAPISKYLSKSIMVLLPSGIDPTIRQLLNHTSGVPDYYSERFYKEDWNRNEPLTPAVALHAIRDLPATIEPGLDFDYSNTNYHLLALVIEGVSGKTVDKLLVEKIFTPLSLQNTYYGLASPPGDIIHGYGSPFDPWEDTFKYRENSGPDGGMFATASDVATWIRALFSSNGDFADIGQVMTQKPISESERKAQGLGVEILTSRNGETIYGHTGSIDGYLSAVFYIPSANTVLVLHVNRSDEQAFKELLVKSLRLILNDIASK